MDLYCRVCRHCHSMAALAVEACQAQGSPALTDLEGLSPGTHCMMPLLLCLGFSCLPLASLTALPWGTCIQRRLPRHLQHCNWRQLMSSHLLRLLPLCRRSPASWARAICQLGNGGTMATTLCASGGQPAMQLARSRSPPSLHCVEHRFARGP